MVHNNVLSDLFSDRIKTDGAFRSLLENLLDPVALLNAVRDDSGNITNFVFLYVNQPGLSDLRLEAENIIDNYFTDIFPDAQNSIFFDIACNVVASGKSRKIKSLKLLIHFAPSAPEGIYDFSLSKLEDGIIISWRDNSHHIQTENNLKETIESLEKKNEELSKLSDQLSIVAERFRRLIEANTVGIVIADFDGEIIEANDYYLNILGYSRAELENKQVRWDLMTPPEYLPLDYKAIEELKAYGTCTPYEKEYFTKSGARRWVLITDALLPGTPPQIVAFIIDTTDRKKSILALERTLTELEQSNKDLEQFAYVASHDLQEPLRMVSSYVRLLSIKFEGRLDNDAQTYIDFAIDGAKRMNNLINDLLVFSRVSTRANLFASTDLNKVISEVAGDLQLLIRENKAEIKTATLPVIKADEVQMRQLFQNLIVNAIKFRNVDPPVIKISFELKNNMWLFSVSDNGIGIDQQFYDRIFMIFQRLHEREKFPGTGIGLAICKKIVERHNGIIWVESQPLKGSTFYFTLPQR
ncbi:MAG: sensor histidine kinase [Methanococcaceae archaeon]